MMHHHGERWFGFLEDIMPAGPSRRTLSDLERDAGNASMASMNRVFRPLGLKVGLVLRQPAMLTRLAEDDASS